MEQAVLNEILRNHSNWLNNVKTGERAILIGEDLRGLDLRGFNLSYSDLRRSNFHGNDLNYTNFIGSDLRESNLSDADLSNTDFSEANLNGANLSSSKIYRSCFKLSSLAKSKLHESRIIYSDFISVNLEKADLSDADIYKSYFTESNFKGSNLSYSSITASDFTKSNFDDAIFCWNDFSNSRFIDTNIGINKSVFIPTLCPESGSFIGWKKVRNNKIIKLKILKDSKRISSNYRECRCDKAKVLAIENIDGTDSGLNEVCSRHDKNFIYKIGSVVEEPNFCEDRFIEDAPGIYFFINREEAVMW